MRELPEQQRQANQGQACPQTAPGKKLALMPAENGCGHLSFLPAIFDFPRRFDPSLQGEVLSLYPVGFRDSHG